MPVSRSYKRVIARQGFRATKKGARRDFYIETNPPLSKVAAGIESIAKELQDFRGVWPAVMQDLADNETALFDGANFKKLSDEYRKRRKGQGRPLVDDGHLRAVLTTVRKTTSGEYEGIRTKGKKSMKFGAKGPGLRALHFGSFNPKSNAYLPPRPFLTVSAPTEAKIHKRIADFVQSKIAKFIPVR